jgi:hypothetical protein
LGPEGPGHAFYDKLQELLDESGVREWAEVDLIPDDRIHKKEHVTPRRYLAIRFRPPQGDLLGQGEGVSHFCIVANRADPEGGLRP